MSMLLASLLTFGRLSGNSEIIAMKACGVSFKRLVTPVIIFSLGVSIFSVGFNEYVVPASNQAYADLVRYEIQGNNEQIIKEAISRGINFGIISKYGSTVPPCIESLDNIGDSVIDCKYSSLGATCAKAYTTLGDDYVQAVDDGHNHLSADGMIDASTCAFPEYTWFIKGLLHNEHYDCEMALCDFIFNSETQPTVWDSENYSQFLIYNNGELEPLTEDNDYYKYENVTAPEESLFSKIIHVIQIIIAAILSLFGLS